MPDPITPAPVPDPTAPAPTDPPNPNPEPVVPAPSDDPVITKAKLEKSVAAEKQLRERLRKLEEAESERARKAAEESGQFKSLYESESAKAKDLSAKLERYEKAIHATRERDLASIPEHLRAFAPEDPEKFAEYVAATRAQAPATTAPAPRPATPPASAPRPADPAAGGKKVWKTSEIEGLSFEERRKAMPEIREAIAEGRIEQG